MRYGSVEWKLFWMRRILVGMAVLAVAGVAVGVYCECGGTPPLCKEP